MFEQMISCGFILHVRETISAEEGVAVYKKTKE